MPLLQLWLLTLIISYSYQGIRKTTTQIQGFLPPVTVKVANSYSATEKPALLWAVTFKLYHVAGLRSKTTKFPPAFTLLETSVQSWWDLKTKIMKIFIKKIVHHVYKWLKSYLFNVNISLTLAYILRQNTQLDILHFPMRLSVMSHCLEILQGKIAVLGSLARLLVFW